MKEAVELAKQHECSQTPASNIYMTAVVQEVIDLHNFTMQCDEFVDRDPEKARRLGLTFLYEFQ